MTKQEWIQAVVSHIADEYQRNAATRQLEENLSKMIRRRNEIEVLKELGDPTEYYEKHFGGKSAKKFNIIAGIVLILVGAFLLLLNVLSANSILFEQIRWAPATRNNVLYGSGLIFAIGIITLVSGILSYKKS